jgi:hypothetical protein
MDALLAPLLLNIGKENGGDIVGAAKAIGVRAKQVDTYWMLDYDMIKADWSSPLTWWCRGLVASADGHVVCCPMRKFFNLGEKHAEELQWDRVRAYEKLDGTMVNRWFHNNAWHVSSRYNMGSGLAKHNMAGVPFDQLIDTALATLDLSMQPHDETWTFEVCSPHNRIVVPYDHVQAHLLSRRRTCDGTELPIDAFPFACPQYTGVTSGEDARRTACAKTGLESEGLVCFDGKTRLKVKNVHYMVHFKFRSQPPWLAVLEAWRTGEESEVLVYAPWLSSLFLELTQLLKRTKDAVTATLQAHAQDDPKSFAEAAKQHHPVPRQWIFLRKRQPSDTPDDFLDWLREHPKLTQWVKDAGFSTTSAQLVHVM